MKLFKLTVESGATSIPSRVEWVAANNAAGAIDSQQNKVIICEFISNLLTVVPNE